jgi:hypothetical protein
MNVPTREEIAALDRKLDIVQEQLDELTAHLVRSEPAAKATKPAARKPAARRTTTTRRRTARTASPKSAPGAAADAAAANS